MPTTTAPPQRNLQLDQLACLLKNQPTRALDVIVGSGAIRANGGRPIPVDVGVAQIDGNGVQPAQAGQLAAPRPRGTLPVPRRVRERDVKPHVSHITKLIVTGKLTHFICGGDVTAGGVMHAVTSVAQTLPDADAAHEMESAALRALDIAAAP